MHTSLIDTETHPAQQQPDWQNHPELHSVRAELAAAPPLVSAADVRALRALLGRAAAGSVQVIQAGDCAEDPLECTPAYVARKAALLDMLAGAMRLNALKPVLRVGRLAGQFGKPRSRPTELVNGVELPVYRGAMVNSPEPDAALRQPDPRRLVSGYRAARDVMALLGWGGAEQHPQPAPQVWTSHEALLLDYEAPMVRRDDETGEKVLTSTHWPWIGERTRQLNGAHVALLAEVANPVAVKLGPGVSPDEALALCERLDPRREPGRLTLIARMGAGTVAEKLPPLASAVKDAGHPVIWLSDPMHGNTVGGPDGLKTRFTETVLREVGEFQCALTAAGVRPGGLHLETTPEDVTECVHDRSDIGRVGEKYTSLCDPRLNPAQAISVASAWSS